MTKSFLLALAAGCSAFAQYINAAEGNTSPSQPEDPAPTTATETRKRGRPAATLEKSEPTGPTTDAKAPVDDEARIAANKALIQPFVVAKRGEEVKAIIRKYSETGVVGVQAKDQKAFEADIESLNY